MTFKGKIQALSGDDPRIIAHCDAATQGAFTTIGLSVVVISSFCMISIFITFVQIFNNHISGALLSLLFSWMITNIYRLLLSTISKDSLPHKPSLYGLGRSRASRMVFICLIAFMISKPLESIVYADLLDHDISMYRMETKKRNHKKIITYYKAQMDEIKRITNDSEYGRQLIAGKILSLQTTLHKADKLTDASGFYFQRLCFLGARHRSCWLITMLFSTLFLYPVWLKYRLMQSDYYLLKSEADKRKVDLNYSAFRKMYASFFSKNYHRMLAYSEPYEDAPYNTIRKKDQRHFLSQNDLISEIYDV